MGLTIYPATISPDERTSWSYDEFACFRQKLAKDGLGVDLDEMQGFGGTRSWEEFQGDPLVLILNHPDNGGEIFEGCENLGARILQIVCDWDDDPHMKAKAKALAHAALRVADIGGLIFR